MKAASQQLIDFLANLSENEPDAAVWVIDLYRFILTNGIVLHWSSGDYAVTLPEGSITGAQLSAAGLGSLVGDTYILNAGNNDAIIEVLTVDGAGALTSFTYNALSTNSTNSPGSGYQIWKNVTVYPGGSQPGSGNGVMINITAVNGTVTYDVLSPANPGIPSLDRSKINSTVGLSVDDLTVTIAATPLVQIPAGSGVTLLTALQTGLFDGAAVTVQRLTMARPGDTSLGTVVWFRGTVGDVQDITKIGAKIVIKALTEYLNVQMPRNLFQPSCRHTLFDPGCTLKASDFTTYGRVLGSPSPTVISFATDLAAPGPVAGPTNGVPLFQKSITGVNLATTTYYVVVTYVTALGETGPSPETQLTIGSGNSNTQNLVLVVDSPPPEGGVLGYNVYIGEQSGSWQRQNGGLIPIGTQFTMDGDGIVQGVPPPTNTTGYYTQGVITFTGGPNSGLSRSVVNYSNPSGHGIVTIIDALPITPNPGDTFYVRPGCDKAMSTCSSPKFNNLIHFGGMPFTPSPETSF